MFKVISSEFKKMFSKPGVYILAVLLAIILILGVFIYEPKVVESSQITLEGTDFLSKYTTFIGDDETDKTKGIKVKADSDLSKTIETVKNYRIVVGDKTYTQEDYIYTLKTEMDKNINAFLECQRLDDDEIDDSYLQLRQSKIKESVINLNQAIINATTNASNGCYSIIMTEETYNNYIAVSKQLVAWANVTNIKKENNGIEKYVLEYKNSYEPSLKSAFSKFIYPDLSDDFIKDFTEYSGQTKLNTLNARLNNIISSIDKCKNEASSSSSKNIALTQDMDYLANEYVGTINTYINLINYELISNAYEYTSALSQMDIKYLSDISEYDANSFRIKYQFLFENDSLESDYSNPLTIGVTSHNEINGYDYSYFVLRLFSFIIIIFAVMSTCHTIAGEIKEGSMRYLAIRPVSRTKILAGKLASIMITTIVLTIFSAIISLGVGFAVYSNETTSILTIFNGKVPIVISPLTMIWIYVVSLILETLIYVSITLLLSCLIKSDLLSVTIMITLLLVNTLLPVFINATNSWLTFYPFSHINLYSLFGSSLYSQQNDFFNILLGAKVYINTNIILTAIVTLILIIIPIIVSIKLFKSKEL